MAEPSSTPHLRHALTQTGLRTSPQHSSLSPLHDQDQPLCKNNPRGFPKSRQFPQGGSLESTAASHLIHTCTPQHHDTGCVHLHLDYLLHTGTTHNSTRNTPPGLTQMHSTQILPHLHLQLPLSHFPPNTTSSTASHHPQHPHPASSHPPATHSDTATTFPSHSYNQRILSNCTAHSNLTYSQPLLPCQGQHSLHHLAQRLTQLAFQQQQAQNIHNLPHKSLPLSHHPHRKQFPSNSQPQLLLSQFGHIPPSPVMTIHDKASLLPFPLWLIRSLEPSTQVSTQPSLLQLQQPQFLTLHSYGSCSTPLTNSVPSFALLPILPCPS